jgi:NAD(P)H-hydrate epimerase
MIPLYSVNQIRKSDEYAINELGIPGTVLMENASVSIFNAMRDYLKNLKDEDFIGIICGKGNNGGDGFALARHLSNKGYNVKVVFLAGGSELTGDAKLNFDILEKLSHKNPNIRLEKYSDIQNLLIFNDAKIIVDALLGTGTKGTLKSPYAEIISELNKLTAVKIAVDIPSGLDADTGYGDIIFNADLTVTLAELKKGLFIEKGYTNSGKVVKGYIGIPEDYFNVSEKKEFLIESSDAAKGLPVKRKDLNKYSAGKVFVIAGSADLPGAAVLTSNAALKMGAGAVILAFPESIKVLAQSKLNEVIVSSYEDDSTGLLAAFNVKKLSERFDWMDVLAIGPGLGRNHRTMEAVIEILNKVSGKKVVIDADAIFALGNGKYKEVNLKNCILTPHHGEFSNLIGVSIAEIKQDVFKYGREFAVSAGCHLVLKGAPTIIFSPDGKALVNTAGNPGLAKFGTGDVLTGIISGLLAQNEDVETSVAAGVYIHSYTADLLLNQLTEFGITAHDISDFLPKTINHLRGHFGNTDKTESTY